MPAESFSIDSLFEHGKRGTSHNHDIPKIEYIDEEKTKAKLIFERLTLTTHELGKGIPSKHRWQGKELLFYATKAAVQYIHHNWPKADWPKGSIINFDPPPSGDVLIPWKPRMKPFLHQEQAYNAGANSQAFAYLLDMGCGKSKVTIDNAAYLVSRHLIDRALVVAPKGVHLQWNDEQLPAHWPVEIKMRCAAVGTGMSKKATPDWWGDWKPTPGKMSWLMVNYDALQNWPIRKALQDFLRAGPSMMVLDESHKIKNSQANRSKLCHQLGPMAHYRRILTGTPMAKGIEDFYSQFQFLDPGIIGVNSWTAFKRTFCDLGGSTGRQIIGYRDTDRFHRLISPHSFRVDKDEVLDLPPKMYDVRYVSINEAQRKAYRELRVELETQLSDGTIISAENAMVRMLRFQQVIQGYLPKDDGTFENIGGEERLEVLDDIIEAAPSKVVVWARFSEDIDRILARYPGISVQYDGRNTKERDAAKRSFIDPMGGKRLFVANQAAGGTGLDGLQGIVNTVVYYSNSFSSLDRWQSEDRTHRIGTKGTVNYYDLVCRGTIDVSIRANLRRKKEVSDMSLAELRSMIEGQIDG